MIYVIYGLAGLFMLFALAMLFAFYRERHLGVLLMAVAYGVSGGLAIALGHWWPLVAGFVVAWLLRLLGLEPGGEARDEGGAMKDGG
jgi:hypothetical protein